MLIEGCGETYYGEEIEFVKYFNRCKSIGMKISEIEINLKYLKKYYIEMVKSYEIKSKHPDSYFTIYNLFDRWSKNKND